VLVTVPVSPAVIAVPEILVLSIAAEALMSAFTIAPVAIDDTRLTELEPLKDTAAASISPVIWKSLAVANVVAVPALPDTVPVTLPVRLPVKVPAIAPVPVMVGLVKVLLVSV